MPGNRTAATPSRIEGTQEVHQRQRMRAIALSFAVSLALLGIKFFTYRLTHSSAVLSDALESIINVAASAFAALSIWMASKPPDPDHPYGHGKIEYFSAGFEGALIVGAAAGIFTSGVRHLLHPHPLPNLETGLLLLIGATFVNLLLGLYLVRVGRRTDSIALEADGKHVLTDVYSSVAAAGALVLVYLTGWQRIDGAVACLIGISILVTGSKLVIQSFKRLMDASDPELLDNIATVLISNRRADWVDIHQLRAWRAGAIVHIDLHLVLPVDLSLAKAHREAKLLETMLVETFGGNADVLVHMDPCEPGECPVCERAICDRRSNRSNPEIVWTRDRLIRSTAADP